jgi:Zn finger protein HypA/HybF involved in hydrogenase expression
MGSVMKFRDLLNNDQLILVACQDCGGKTPVDPALPALEHGVDADVDNLRSELHCPVCGSSDVELRAHSPVAHMTAARPRASERA